MSLELPLGPLIVGFDGHRLDRDTAEMLRHPAVGGVILFARNYDSPEQLRALTAELAALREPRLLITVDQEGGRVQRLRAGFTALPPLGLIGRWYRSHPDRARDLAYRHGRVMAAEVIGHGIDLSWAPVLDLDRGSRVIGDRALSDEPDAVVELAAWYIAGLRDAGMSACGKHFPGHGSVAADSHDEIVIDERPLAQLTEDLAPFARLVDQLQTVMMAHVCYPARDPAPAGFARSWVQDCLRGELGFAGLVVSDDLDMAGAAPGGDLFGRLERAFDAGCDLALVCRTESARAVLARNPGWPLPDPAGMLRLHARPLATLDEQLTVSEFQAWRQSLQQLSQAT